MQEKSMAELVREKTHNGEDLVQWLIVIATTTGVDSRIQLEAVKYLYRIGWPLETFYYEKPQSPEPWWTLR